LDLLRLALAASMLDQAVVDRPTWAHPARSSTLFRFALDLLVFVACDCKLDWLIFQLHVIVLLDNIKKENTPRTHYETAPFPTS
jgi:hypothetical protein